MCCWEAGKAVGGGGRRGDAGIAGRMVEQTDKYYILYII